jgi:hypothetical protein
MVLYDAMATALNPPPPPGAKIWKRPVPPDMTAWASGIVHDPTTYPMGATETRDFNGVTAMARVEWHNNRAGVPVDPPIRGVTIYELGAGGSPGGSGAPTCQAGMSLVPGQSCPIVVDGAPAGVGLGKVLAFGAGGAVAYLLAQWALHGYLARA